MKFKTTAIALAVAGTVAVPMAAQADLYASARIGLQSVDTGGANELAVGGIASRFGMRSETDLGNGMTGFGRYEFSVSTEGAGTTVGRRHAYVGLKGDFGSVTMGQTYHTFYNHIIGPYDIPWVGSNKYSAASANGRNGEGITYAGGSDGISFGATLYFQSNFEKTVAAPAVPAVVNPDGTINVGTPAVTAGETGEEGLDGFEVAATFGIGDMSLGIGIQDFETGTPGNQDEESAMGVTLSGIALGDASLAVSFQTRDKGTDVIALHGGFGNFYAHYESSSPDLPGSVPEPTMITIGYNMSLGRKLTMPTPAFQMTIQPRFTPC